LPPYPGHLRAQVFAAKRLKKEGRAHSLDYADHVPTHPDALIEALGANGVGKCDLPLVRLWMIF